MAAGRLRKATQFLDAATDVSELAEDEADVRDAAVTLFVHAGIAASDVICIRRLGEFALGDRHDDAARLLERSARSDGPELAGHLLRLLSIKTKAGYTHRPCTASEAKRSERAAQKLVAAARAA